MQPITQKELTQLTTALRQEQPLTLATQAVAKKLLAATETPFTSTTEAATLIAMNKVAKDIRVHILSNLFSEPATIAQNLFSSRAYRARQLFALLPPTHKQQLLYDIQEQVSYRLTPSSTKPPYPELSLHQIRTALTWLASSFPNEVKRLQEQLSTKEQSFVQQGYLSTKEYHKFDKSLQKGSPSLQLVNLATKAIRTQDNLVSNNSTTQAYTHLTGITQEKLSLTMQKFDALQNTEWRFCRRCLSTIYNYLRYAKPLASDQTLLQLSPAHIDLDQEFTLKEIPSNMPQNYLYAKLKNLISRIRGSTDANNCMTKQQIEAFEKECIQLEKRLRRVPSYKDFSENSQAILNKAKEELLSSSKQKPCFQNLPEPILIDFVNQSIEDKNIPLLENLFKELSSWQFDPTHVTTVPILIDKIQRALTSSTTSTTRKASYQPTSSWEEILSGKGKISKSHVEEFFQIAAALKDSQSKYPWATKTNLSRLQNMIDQAILDSPYVLLFALTPQQVDSFLDRIDKYSSTIKQRKEILALSSKLSTIQNILNTKQISERSDQEKANCTKITILIKKIGETAPKPKKLYTAARTDESRGFTWPDILRGKGDVTPESVQGFCTAYALPEPKRLENYPWATERNKSQILKKIDKAVLQYPKSFGQALSPEQLSAFLDRLEERAKSIKTGWFAKFKNTEAKHRELDPLSLALQGIQSSFALKTSKTDQDIANEERIETLLGSLHRLPVSPPKYQERYINELPEWTTHHEEEDVR